jgi:arginyl-tRNA synthetase
MLSDMEEIQQALQAAAQQLFGQGVTAQLTRTDEQFGDYATNVAMQLAGLVGKPPRAVAEELVPALRTRLGDRVRVVDIAGPGFINITLSDALLAGQAASAPTTKPQTFAGQTIVTEYSDPNPFKVLHAGHLYTTVVGDVISRLYEVAGANVHRLNYGGDVGLHVGRAMWGIIKHLGGEYPDKLQDVPADSRPEWIAARYVEGNTAYEENEQAKAEIISANQRVYAVHKDKDHDSDFARIYWTCRTWSYEGFDALYKRLHIAPFEKYVPESEVTPRANEMVDRALEAGVLTMSDGAVVFKGEDRGLHTRVFRNSAGLPTYEAKDLGLAATKWQEYHFDRSVIITANDIVEYMKVILAVLADFYPEVVSRSAHLTHGLIKLPGGRKMSSRKGNVTLASDILEAAVAANKASGNDDYDVVVGAVKYAFIKQRIGGNIIYNPEESVSLEGNSGPYLQYAHARARSILRKAEGRQAALGDNFDTVERTLARKISEYPEAVSKAVSELMPHHIATYLYELSQAFNRFYEQAKVIGDPRETVRLQLVTLYADTLRDGLGLLGITAPEQM